MGPRGRDHRAPHRRARAVDDAAALAARRRPLARRGGLRLGLPDPQLAARARAGVRWVRGEPDRLQPPVDVRRPRGFAARVVLKTPPPAGAMFSLRPPPGSARSATAIRAARS